MSIPLTPFQSTDSRVLIDTYIGPKLESRMVDGYKPPYPAKIDIPESGFVD